jgi:hypothetical protein
MSGVYDNQQFQDHMATKIGAGQVIVLGNFSVIDWVTGGTTNIKGDYIRTGHIESTNWAVGAGSQFDLDAGTFKLGGSAAPKLSWDGSTLIITGTIYATAGEFTGTLKVTNIQAGSALTVLGTIIAGGGNVKISPTGINIFGLNNALTTRATEAGTIQCYVGTDGKFYAGAGIIVLDATGLHIDCGIGASGFDIFQGSYHSYIYQASDVLYINASDSGDIILDAKYSGGYVGKVIVNAKCFSLPYLASDPSSPLENEMYYNSTIHMIKYYNGTSWKTLAYVI